MAESHPSNEEAKGKCKEVLKESQRKLEVEEEEKKEDEMIFVLPDEAEFLELPEIKEKFLKEDELNQGIQPNKTTKDDVQENDAMKVLPFTEQSSLASTLLTIQGTIRFDLMHNKDALKLEFSCDDYIRVLIGLWEQELTVLCIKQDQPLRYLKTHICSRKVELKVLYSPHNLSVAPSSYCHH